MRSVSRCARSRGAGEGGRGQRDGGATGTESGVSVTVTVQHAADPTMGLLCAKWLEQDASALGRFVLCNRSQEVLRQIHVPQIHVPMNGIECGGRHRSQSPLIRLRALFWRFVPPS